MLELAARRGVDFPLRTERLTLTPFTPDDGPAAWAVMRREEVWTWTAGRHHGVEELTEAWLAAGDLLVARAGEEVVGNAKLTVQDAWSQGGPHPDARDAQAELGWTVAPEHAGRGYATEIGRALLDLAFSGLGVRRVEAGAFADNAPSLRVMAKIGLRHEGTFLGESLHLTRGWIDGVTFALLASEYEGGAAASRA